LVLAGLRCRDLTAILWAFVSISLESESENSAAASRDLNGGAVTRRYDLSRRRCARKLSVPDKERNRRRSAVDSVDTWRISWLRTREVRCVSVGVTAGRATGNVSMKV
jgi:hypothetical protein